MRGLLYKDLCILLKDWKTSVFGILGISWPLFLPLGLVDAEKIFLPKESITFMIFPIIIYPLLFYMIGNHQNSIFEPDEHKKWNSFIIASPLGAKGQVLSKYYLVLLIGFTAYLLGFVFDMISSLIIGVYGSASGIYSTLFFMNIIMRSVEMPFLFRYGSKNAENIRTCMLLMGVMIVSVYLLFGPLPQDFGLGKFFEYIYQLYNRETMLPTLVTGVIALIPYVAIGMYYISYKISVKLYVKGAMEYEN